MKFFSYAFLILELLLDYQIAEKVALQTKYGRKCLETQQLNEDKIGESDIYIFYLSFIIPFICEFIHYFFSSICCFHFLFLYCGFSKFTYFYF